MENTEKSKKRKRESKIKSFEHLIPNLIHPNFTQRTAIIFSQKGESVSSQPLQLGLKIGLPIYKDVIGSCIEGILTYCKIMFDLSPQSLVNIFSAGNTVTRLNQWNIDVQIEDLLYKIIGTKSVAKSTLLKSLELAIRALAEPIHYKGEGNNSEDDSVPSRTRIICIFQDQTNGSMNQSTFTCYYQNQGSMVNLIDSAKLFIAMANEEISNGLTQGSQIQYCDIVFIAVISDTTKPVPYGKTYQLSDSISIETHFVTTSTLRNAFIDLAVSHLSLGSLNISMPTMRKSHNLNQILEESKQSIIEIVYSNANTIHILNPTQTHLNSTLGAGNWRKDTTFCKIIEAPNISADSLATSSAHRVVIVNNQNIFLKYLEEGKAILLSNLSSETNKPNMFIKMHGNMFYLHKLYDDKLCLNSVPDFFGSKSSHVNLNDYRVEEFMNIVKQNMMTASDRHLAKRARVKVTSNVEKNECVSTKNLTKMTNSFVISKYKTILFGSQTEELKQIINQIIPIIKKNLILPNELTLATEAISKLFQEIKINNNVILPERDPEKRKSKYNQLKEELARLADNYKQLSDNHMKLSVLLNTFCPEILSLAEKKDQKEDVDPNKYRYMPKYKYSILSEIKLGSDDKEKRYAEKTHREIITLSPLESINKNSLQYVYWTKFNENHKEHPFSGYPKEDKIE